jgi:hypothetical protein
VICVEACLERIDERREWKAKCGAERPDLNDVKPALAALAFAHERLALSYPDSKLKLSNARFFASSPKLAKEQRVLSRCNAFVHGSV